MRHRIAFTIPNLDTAGSGKAMTNLIEGLDRERFEPLVVVDRFAESAVAQRLDRMDVPVVNAAVKLPASPRTTLPLRARHLGRARRDLDAALWHSFNYLDDYTEPLVAHAAGARWLYTKKSMSWNKRSWRLRTRLADAVLAQNTDMMEQFFPQNRRAHVHLVPRGVPVDQGDRVTPASQVRSDHELPDDVPIVTCVARIEPRKRQTILVRSLALVPDAHLVLAGLATADSGAAVDEAASETGVIDRVHRIGHVEDVDGLIGASAVVVLPTAAKGGEGCPVALLEAMALGATVVVTDVPGSRDVVRPDHDGLVVPADDVPALGAALRRLLADPELRERLGRNARDRVLERYTIEHEVRNHERVYDELLQAR